MPKYLLALFTTCILCSCRGNVEPKGFFFEIDQQQISLSSIEVYLRTPSNLWIRAYSKEASVSIRLPEQRQGVFVAEDSGMFYVEYPALDIADTFYTHQINIEKLIILQEDVKVLQATFRAVSQRNGKEILLTEGRANY